MKAKIYLDRLVVSNHLLLSNVSEVQFFEDVQLEVDGLFDHLLDSLVTIYDFYQN